MADSWLNNQQWTSGTQGSGTPPVGRPGWGQQQGPTGMGGVEGGWQTMQQGPPANSYQTNQQFRPPSGPGQFPYQNQGFPVPFQVQGRHPYPGQGQFQRVPQGFVPRQQFGGPYPGGAMRGPGPGPPPAGNYGFQGSPPQHRQQPQMSPQLIRQQQQQALEQQLKEEQRQRELELQRRKMQKMDLTKASMGNLDDLIGKAAPKTSGSPTKTRAKKPPSSGPHTEPGGGSADKQGGSELPQNKTTSSNTFSESSKASKAHSWTADSASLEGVFAQHSQLGPPSQVGPSADSFGDFQSGPTGGSEHGGRETVGGAFREAPYPGGREAGGVGGGRGGGRGGGSQEYPNLPGQGPPYGGLGNQPQANQRNILSRKVPQGPVSVTTANIRPVASTSVSGWTKEGYVSSDVTQSHSYGGFSRGRGGGRPHPSPPSRAQLHDQSSSAPKFAGLDSSRFPVVYMDVYRRCVIPGGVSISTELLFPMLLSSHLQRSVLRDLWTVANRGVPGKLNQTELFVLLGLVALVQSGNSSPTLDDLKRSPQPPVPVLAALSTEPSAPPQDHNTQNQMATPLTSSQSVLPPTSTSQDDFSDFQQGSTAKSIHVPSAPMSVQNMPHMPTTAASQTTTELSSVFAVPEYRPPPGDKYSVFEALAQANDQGNSGSYDNSELEENTSNAAASRDRYADLAALASSSHPSATGEKVVLVPTHAQSSVHSQPVPGSSSILQPMKNASREKGGKKQDEEEVFGSFLSGPSVLQPLSLATTSTGENSVMPSSRLSSAATLRKEEAAEDEFGSFASGPSLSTVQQPTQADKKDSGWADFAHQFVSQPDVPLQPSTLSSTSSSLAPPTKSAPKQPTSSTTNTNLSLGPSLNLFSTSAPSTAPSTSSLDNLSFFSAGSKNDNIATSAASLLGDLNLGPSKFSPKSSKKVTTKAASGLELLEEEFSNRILSSRQDRDTPPPAPPPLALSPTLVPEPSGPGSATSLDKFGEFEGYCAAKGDGLECQSGSATSFGKSPPDPGKVWKNCLMKCGEVLHQCAEVLGGCKNDEDGLTLLSEVATSEEGQNKLKGIVEVYKLARRIHACVKDNDCGDSEFSGLVDHIKVEWDRLDSILPGKIMEKLFQESISPAASGGNRDKQLQPSEEDILSDTISRCSLCLMGKEVSISSSSSFSSAPERYSLPLLFHCGKTYHATCCNFWANVVQETLPDLSD